MHRTIRPIAVPAALLGCALAATASEAAVYVCSNDACSAWTAITPAQSSARSTDGNNATVDAALRGSQDESVRNGYNSVAGTNLYLKRSLWHRGGVTPIANSQHVTAYVWRGQPYQHVKTCHVFSYQVNGVFQTTCTTGSSRTRSSRRR